MTEFTADLGEIGQRWCKRAAKEMNTHHQKVLNWVEQGDYMSLAVFVLNAFTTGKGD